MLQPGYPVHWKTLPFDGRLERGFNEGDLGGTGGGASPLLAVLAPLGMEATSSRPLNVPLAKLEATILLSLTRLSALPALSRLTPLDMLVVLAALLLFITISTITPDLSLCLQTQ
jgi:hypothetical protein